jgi:16S rRNA C1402 N4-methylase RsmH
LKISLEQRSLLASLINEVDDAICDMDRKNILTKHKHIELESIFKKIAVKLVDQDIFQELQRKKDERQFWATADLKAVVKERMKQQEMKKKNEE